MKKLITVLFFAFFGFLTVNASSLAQTPTEVRQDIKEKVQERIEQISQQAKTKAFFGTLKEINTTTLIIEGPKGERRIKTDESTQFVNPSKKTLKLTDLEIGNFIIAMGFWKENGTLEGKRVVVLPQEPKKPAPRIAFMGKITDISKDEKILSVTEIKKDGITYEVKVNDKTMLLTKQTDGKINKVSFESLALGDRLVIIGLKEKENNAVTAKIIHVIPLSSASTPTPTIKLTPTPTQKLTPTPMPTRTP